MLTFDADILAKLLIAATNLIAAWIASRPMDPSNRRRSRRYRADRRRKKLNQLR